MRSAPSASVREAARLLLAGDLVRDGAPRSLADVALQSGYFDA